MRIGEVAARTGVPPATLRAWERRYGALCPERTVGGQRVYGPDDVARVRALTALIDSGVRVSDAARALLSIRTESPRELADLLVRHVWAAVDSFDSPTATASIHEATDLLGIPDAIDYVFVPVLRRLGDEWRASPRNIAREHLASGLLRTHLVELLPRSSGPDSCIAFCPDGERHDLGLIMGALVLADHGWHVVVLGADTPLASINLLTDELRPAVLLIGAALRKNVTRLYTSWRPPKHVVTIAGGAGFQAEDHDRFGVVVHSGRFAELPATLRHERQRHR